MKIKNVALILVLLVFPVTVNAATWCNWTGSEGENCQSDSKGFIRTAEGLPVGVSTAGLNPRGWYELTDTQPTIGEDQVRDEVQWSIADNQISHTRTVRDLSAEEIDERTASAMSLSDWRQWSAIQLISGATNQQMRNYMGDELVEQWLARNRLENP